MGSGGGGTTATPRLQSTSKSNKHAGGWQQRGQMPLALTHALHWKRGSEGTEGTLGSSVLEAT
jgi:hypothetical protein